MTKLALLLFSSVISANGLIIVHLLLIISEAGGLFKYSSNVRLEIKINFREKPH